VGSTGGSLATTAAASSSRIARAPNLSVLQCQGSGWRQVVPRSESSHAAFAFLSQSSFSMMLAAPRMTQRKGSSTTQVLMPVEV
jgi:hypothetical protein